MKLAAAKDTSSHSRAEGAFRRLLRSIGAELRRGIELAGAKYQHGMLPPL